MSQKHDLDIEKYPSFICTVLYVRYVCTVCVVLIFLQSQKHCLIPESCHCRALSYCLAYYTNNI